MAEIYLGKAIGSDDFQRICAIKRILPHYAQETEYLEMFRAEARIGKRLQHANIVQVYDFKRVDDTYAIIMEFVDGSDLRSLLAACENARVRLSVPMSVFIAAQAARGLHYAHTRVDEITRKPLEIVHRDISPQNLLLSYEGEVKVIDFGIAKFESRNQETKPGVVKGKYSYMSPEQVTAKPLDARTDIFSLAVVLWEILAMKRLFAGESEVETIRNVQNCSISANLQELNKSVDDALLQIILKGLAKDRKRRYQSAAAFEKDLLRYLNSRYPEFTASDLGNFVRQIFAKKRADTQKNIKELLTATDLNPDFQSIGSTSDSQIRPLNGPPGSLPPSVYNDDDESDELFETHNHLRNDDEPIQLELSDNGRHLRLSTRTKTGRTFTGTNKNIPSQANRLPTFEKSEKKPPPPYNQTNRFQYRTNAVYHKVTVPKQKSNWGIIGFLLALLVVSAGFFVAKKHFGAKGSMRIYLRSTPSTVQVALDGKSLFNGEYISTPKTLFIPATGKHQLTIMRQNYLPQFIEFNGKNGDTIKIDGIVLSRNPKARMIPTIFQVSPRKKVWINLDNGYFKGFAPIKLNRLSYGQKHTIDVYPNYPKRKDAFRCSFVSKPNTRSKSYSLLIQLPTKTRKAQCIAN